MKSNLKVLVSTLAVGTMAVTLFAVVPASAKHNDQVAQASLHSPIWINAIPRIPAF